MRVLHVEDNPVDLDLTRRLLARQAPEIQLDPAESRQMAMERLLAVDGYDLALIDLRLPDGSGLDLLAWIRDRQLPLAVVMLTGSGDQQSAIAALQAGADDYLTKGAESFGRLPATLRDAWARFHAASSRRARPLHVLYAEHSAADIDLTRRHLARHAPHIRLQAVPDTERVLALLPSRAGQPADFDAVLLDYRLPGLDALEAVKVLRAERGLDIPIVLITGQGSEALAARAMHLGVDDYLSKHDGYLHKLPATLEKVIGQAELARERAVLQETSGRLELALANSPAVLYTRRLDVEGARLTWVSGNSRRLFGIDPELALCPQWWAAHLHPGDRERVLARHAAGDQADAALAPYRLFDGLGRLRWIQEETRVVEQADGRPREIAGAWRDITEAKLAEQIRETRLAVLDGLIAERPLDEILDTISRQLESIHTDMRVSFEVYETPLEPAASNAIANPRAYSWCAPDPGAPEPQPDAGPAPWLAWCLPLRSAAGHVLGVIRVSHAERREPSADELELVGEFSLIAGLAIGRVRTDTRLRQAATVFECTREGVIITDLDTRILTVNRAYTEITGYTEAEVKGRKPNLLRSGRQDPSFYQTMWASIQTSGHWQGELWNRRKSGEIYPQLLSISSVYDAFGQPSHYVGVMTDISRLKRSEAQLEHLVHYDPLTNLPNRRLVQSRLQHAIDRAERQHEHVGVLFLDLDRFKNVNDSLGHPVGDELLEALTGRLSARLREDDTLGRLGGDEFLILLENLQRPEDAGSVAQSLLQLLEEPFVLPSGPELYMGASIGISLYPEDGSSVTELIKHADVAMYQAKEQGRNTYRFYTPTLTQAANERLDLEARLRRALANDEFVLYYQPQFDSQGRTLIGCEALVRWFSPEDGMVSPDRFIPLAEETGLIVPLGDWVLRTACAQGRLWLDEGWAAFTIAVNLSGRQLQQRDLVSRVAAILELTGLPPERLKLELTESMIMLQGEQAATLLQALKSLGLRLSIDDFGTGYSSLAHLKRFPIDELKIDRSFVRDIPQDQSDMEIAATIIAMARNLNLRVIAEGVETRSQLDFLIRQGCHGHQGYLLGHPLAAGDFARQLLQDD